jgi:hypothetical protein
VSQCDPGCRKTYKCPSYKVGRHWLKFVYKYGNAQICVLLWLVKKKVVAVSFMEAFPMAGIALQVEGNNQYPWLNSGEGVLDF